MGECGPDCTCDEAQKRRELAAKIRQQVPGAQLTAGEPYMVRNGPFKGRIYQRLEDGSLVRRRALEEIR